MLRNIDVLNAGEYREAIRYYDVSPNGDKGSDVDAMDEILQNGYVQQYALSVQGGGENTQYRISGNLLNQDGIVIHTGLKKYGMDLSSRTRFSKIKQLSLNIGLNANQYIQDYLPAISGSSGVTSTALNWNPTSPLRNPDGSLNFSNGIAGNPLATAELTKNSLKVTTVLASIAPSFRITRWLEYKLLLSVNYSTGTSRSSVNQALLYPFDPRGTATVGNNELLTKQVSNTLNARKSFGNGFGVDGLFGYDYMSFSYKGFSATGTGAQGIGFGNFGLDYTNYIQYSGTIDRSIASFADPVSELQSFFARAGLNYKEKYLLTATIRADGSTKFGDNRKYGVFPSLAASWLISEENFFSSKTIQLLKMRAGWGITGNQEFPAGSSQAKYSFRDNGTIIQVNAPNPDLQWQQDQQINLGIDFRLWNGRFYGSIDYFSKKTTRLLFPSPPIQPSPPSAVLRWINLDGTIANKGLELGLNGMFVEQENFSLDLNFNATFQSNKVSGIPSAIPTGYLAGSGVSGISVQVIQDGLPMNSFFTRKFNGIDPATGLSTYEDEGNTFYVGGNPNPSTLLGFGASMHFRDFSASINFYGAFGQDIFFNTLLNVLSVNNMATQKNIAQSLYEEPVKESTANPTTPSSRYIFKSNYLKLSNLTFSYEFGKRLKFLQHGSIYLTGQNLFLFTKYPGFDPESNFDAGNNGIPSLGIDFSQYPSSRIIRLGIKLSIQ
jgi:iron complex outermembrane receptor protein